MTERFCVDHYEEFTLTELDFDCVVADILDRLHPESCHVSQHVVVERFTDFSAVEETLRCVAFESLFVWVPSYGPAVVLPVLE